MLSSRGACGASRKRTPPTIVIPERERSSASEPGIPKCSSSHVEVPGSLAAVAARAPG